MLISIAGTMLLFAAAFGAGEKPTLAWLTVFGAGIFLMLGGELP